MYRYSIIIPTYNSAATLPDLLGSIAGQGEAGVEVIVQDGGSTDDTAGIAARFSNEIPSLKLVSGKDEGIYDAMNKAMARASGEWLIFMGSDDRFHNNTVLELVSNTLQATTADVVYGNARIIGDTGWAKDGQVYDGPFDLQKLLNQNICHQAMFYRREFVQQEIGEFHTGYKKSSDWDFNLRCWAKKPFEYMDLVIADFAAGGASTDTADHVFAAEFLPNVMQYFGWSPGEPLLYAQEYWFSGMLKKMKAETNPVENKLVTFVKRIGRKVRKLLS